ncbi:hypothetical protein [Clostridium estertheticum]|uniref:hypothetical protein n=1 Tax=Clostridium estertheticum TaxID=238834 RepID=UPI002714B006|nr:hypothetical protein [Clostridium estertheticum]WLC90994.1 hypothetical protein KTC95_23115 [Clostridium estertheticum]
MAIKNKELEASEMKVYEIVHGYIDRLYFDLIKFRSRTFNNVKSVFGNVVKNGLNSHKKDKKTVFDILGVCYKQMSSNVNFAA